MHIFIKEWNVWFAKWSPLNKYLKNNKVVDTKTATTEINEVIKTKNEVEVEKIEFVEVKKIEFEVKNEVEVKDEVVNELEKKIDM